MIAEKHDFFMNFSNAVASQDAVLASQLLANEYAEVIAYYPKNVVQAIQDSGIKIKTPASDKDIVNALVENLDKSSELRHRMATLIALNTNTISFSDDTLNSSGEGASALLKGIFETGSGAAGGATAGPAGAIVGAVAGATSSVFGFLKSKKEAEVAKQEMRTRMLESINARKGGQSKGLSTGAIIGISLGGVALITLAIFAAKAMATKKA